MKEINPLILQLLEIEDFPIKELTDEQKKQLRENFTPNLSCRGVFYSEGYGILITDKDTYKNWLYYAGFEYIKEHDLINVRGDFAVFFSNENERVSELEERFFQTA